MTQLDEAGTRGRVSDHDEPHPVSARLSRVAGLLALVAVAVQILPLWLLTRFPDQDGPAHLASSVAISGAYKGAAASVLDAYVRIHLDLGRNPLGHLLLAAAVRETGALTGPRLFLTAYFVVFAIAGWYAMSAMRRSGGLMATLLLPVASGYFFLLGFWDFLLSVVGALFVIGYWLRHHDDDGASKYVVVAALLLLTSLFHPSGLILALPVVGLIALSDARAQDLPRAASRLGLAALACMPALVPAKLVSDNASGSTPRPPLSRSVEGLFGLSSVVRVMHSHAELVVTVAFILTLATLFAGSARARVRVRGARVGDVLLLVAVVCGLGALVAPNAADGAEILNERLALFAVVSFTLWLAAQPAAARLRTGAAVAGAVLAIALVAVRFPTYRSLDGDLREITSVESAMVPGRTYVVVRSTDSADVDRLTRGLRTDPFRSVTGYFASERKLVALDNYEGRYQYFPYQYVAARDPVRNLFLVTDPRRFEVHPPLDLVGYYRRTGGRVDYVVVLGPPDAVLVRQLATGYERIAVSSRSALVTVFARRPGA